MRPIFYIFFLNHLDQPNRSITKAMLEDRALGQCFSTRGGREIKLQYNIFTNIMTRMLSNVKKYIAYK